MTRRSMVYLVASMVLLTLSGSVFAGPDEDRVAARYMIKRTARVIRVAHRQVNEHKVYTGDLSKAVAHQKFARQLFQNAEYTRAMNQTKVARRFAVRAITANKGVVPQEGNFTSGELSMTKNGPSDEQLSRELHAAMPAEPMQDDAVIKLGADIDVK